LQAKRTFEVALEFDFFGVEGGGEGEKGDEDAFLGAGVGGAKGGLDLNLNPRAPRK
jgi:hypothetical protein